MYHQIINELNRFLNSLNVPATRLNPDAFQGVFIKKLSNQNIVKDKRRINAGDTTSTVNQTHIDITGRQSMLFFFEELNSETTSVQSIDIDLFENNLSYLRAIDNAIPYQDSKGNIYFIRSNYQYPIYLDCNDITLHSFAYKKYGHTGNQVQINLPDAEEPFTQLQKCAFQNDALVVLRYDYLRYMALLIPSDLCKNLYTITNTKDNQNVNVAILNPLYNFALAHKLQYETITKDLIHDDIAAITLQNTLINHPGAGTDIQKLVKTRVSQGSFRRLLLLEYHHCCLCDITTTSVLRASHIKEWAVSSKDERMDSDNGLLLCANHDALFDRHLISFEPNTGNLCISSSINLDQRKALNLPTSLRLPMSERMKAYMQIHYKKFKEKENL
ncbi:MAG: HNH endonuclease [Tyzzerella sp.]|nr:HNH endonuclease [Tyzzerella sp.]